MKKIINLIIAFIILSALTLIGCLCEHKILVFIGAIASAVLGSIASIIIESIDSHGHGLKLWIQHILYYNKDIRLSFSYLYNIQVDGKYLLIKGNRLNTQFQPVGVVYKYYEEAKPVLESFGFHSDLKMKNYDETDDLRINIKGKYLIKFMDWFLLMKDREYDPYREFKEELIDTGYLPENEFKIIKYRKKFIHNKGVEYSKYLQCNEYLYSDIFELKLTEKQCELTKKAVENNPQNLCLATAEELKTECYGGINKNIGTNAIWLLGE